MWPPQFRPVQPKPSSSNAWMVMFVGVAALLTKRRNDCCVELLPGLTKVAKPTQPASVAHTAIASDERSPTAIAIALPALPSTDAGGLAWPEKSSPQQATAPVPNWIAQLWKGPAAIAIALPALPSTDAGGLA